MGGVFGECRFLTITAAHAVLFTRLFARRRKGWGGRGGRARSVVRAPNRENMVLSRRQFLKGLALMSAGTAGFGGYAVAEPWRLNVTRYALTPPRWPKGLNLKLAVVADIHACEPWMGLDRIRRFVARTNATNPDAVLLLGDYVAGQRMSRMSSPVPRAGWANALAELSAPLGVHAVLGNHDWWEDRELQSTRSGIVPARTALEDAGIPVYENGAVRLMKDGEPFWLAGLGDQWAYWPTADEYPAFVKGGRIGYTGVHDLSGTLAKVNDGAPVILMAHEPDIFPEVPDRVALTISGHTHGGQIRVAGFAPIVPSKYGRRYVYGHIVENGRNLIVSGGLGCSGFPLRFGSQPEIVVVELGGERASS